MNMPPVRVDVWSDFVCPYCYVAAFSLHTLRDEGLIDLRWRSYELRPAGSPPMDPAYRDYIETTSRPRFNHMMQTQHGITPNPGPFGIVSRDALIIDKYAEAQGVGHAFHDAVFYAYWQAARDISDHAVLADIAAAAGLDSAAALAALRDPQYERHVLADIAQARQLGIEGVPALVFEQKYLVSGAQPIATLRDVIAQVREAV